MSTIALKIRPAWVPGRKDTRPPLEVSLSGTSSAADLLTQVAQEKRRSVHRVRLQTQDKQTIPNDERKTLASLGYLKDGDTLLYKDLGPQISWRTVFLTEYVGPLIIHPLFYFYGPQLIYNYLPKSYASHGDFQHSRMQVFAFGMVMIHYLKRELETIFVHRFSSATMPIFNIFKNSAYYWGLSGFGLAIPLYGPWYSAAMLPAYKTVRGTPDYQWLIASAWLFAQISNFICHLILRNLRPASDPKRRAIPSGYAFDAITCPNYFFESLGWFLFTLLTLNPASALFWAVGTGQMMLWAGKKQRNYKKEFGKDYPKRWIMFPWVY